MNPKVDFYFAKAKKWKEEVANLRRIILECGLTEELKWGVPCYTSDKSNVVLIHDFKEYCAVLFHKGALLKDPHHILIQQTENVQAARQVRFSSLKEVLDLEIILKTTILEAIEVEKTGQKVEFKPTREFTMPEEFEQKLNENPALKSAFEALTPGRQRAYLLHFSQPKQAKTRAARVEKYTPQILEGLGLND
ncbi:MAG: YdeI/OmpD-associated family protein [Bacteroidia bacterium]|nr:YdeI/OmpD-associated family protein [Bacteroidia bacterium]